MTTFVSAKALDKGSEAATDLQAVDFLLGPEEFVSRCLAAYSGVTELLTLPQRALLAEAIRAGRPRIEVLEAVRRLANPAHTTSAGTLTNGLAREWDNFVAMDQLIAYAPQNDSIFVEQVYLQTLNRLPTAIEAIEAKFDLKGGLSRTKFVEQIAQRSPACRLSSDVLPLESGKMIGRDGRLYINLIQQTTNGDWAVPHDVFIQQAPTVDGSLQLNEGLVLAGPKRSLPPGKWHLSLDLVQPESSQIIVEVIANSGLDVLARVDLVGAARMVMAVLVEPWHHFVEVRLFKAAELEHLRKLKIREVLLRQA